MKKNEKKNENHAYFNAGERGRGTHTRVPSPTIWAIDWPHTKRTEFNEEPLYKRLKYENIAFSHVFVRQNTSSGTSKMCSFDQELSNLSRYSFLCGFSLELICVNNAYKRNLFNIFLKKNKGGWCSRFFLPKYFFCLSIFFA